MISKAKNPTFLIQGLEEAAKTLQGQQSPDWFKQLRAEGLSRYKELGIPSTRDEEWKYTNLDSLSNNIFRIAKKSARVKQAALRNYCDNNEINIIFINGIFSEELSSLSAIPDSMSISTLQDAILNNDPQIKALLTKNMTSHESAFVALNKALNDNGTFINIHNDTISDKLIHIIHLASPDEENIASMPRTLINIGKSSEATILESHIALNDQMIYFSNALTDIFINENATLHYCKSQKESLKAYHIGHTRVWQEGNSTFDGFSFMAGSILARNNLDVIIDGEGANTNLRALYSVHNDQHVDNHTFIDHRLPNCNSNQLYRGILNHAARAVFNGKVFVRSVAQKTNSYQLNKNLLLGKNCRVDTKPQLEISADDVKCTHGATIGQLDEDEMFYLQTRCISRNIARKMLAHGFVDGLFNTISNDSIREKLSFLMKPSFEALL